VSRDHALIRRAEGQYLISDLGSANGTFVNQQMLAAGEARSLKPGDVIGVGDFQLTVSSIS
jgi:pSer/pThr/pTyr-binding forkhead associated (FHA) protein